MKIIEKRVNLKGFLATKYFYEPERSYKKIDLAGKIFLNFLIKEYECRIISPVFKKIICSNWNTVKNSPPAK